MTAEEAINFIHRNVWQGSKPGLSRTRELLSRIGNPESALRFVHVAGTNGKGSVSAMLSAILRSAGYTVGLYTSPYISRFNERIQVNGVPIADTELAEITEFCSPLALSMPDRPTEFELVTAIAMRYFYLRNCDIVILEAGMGGRLDSTNIIQSPLCSVITNIGLDHTKELGNTEEKIAYEKAGIIKNNCPTVIYELKGSVMQVVADRCLETDSPLTIAEFDEIVSVSDSREGQVFSYKDHLNLSLPLLGTHQLKNAAVALETIDVLRNSGFSISESAVRDGISRTVWPARFEILSDKPFFVVDGGHNPQCAETVADNLKRYFPDMRIIILFGVLADKDYMGLASILDNVADAYITITPNSPRAQKASELAKKMKCFGKPVFSCDTIEDGIENALSLAGEDGIVCSVGSLYTAGTVRAYFGK